MLLLGVRTGGEGECGLPELSIIRAQGIAHNRGQMSQQPGEAQGRRAVCEPAAVHLGQSRLGAPGRGNRIALPRRVRRHFVREQKRLPGFGQVPLYVIGEHAEEDVGLDACFQAMPDRAHLKIDALQRPEGALHLGQPLIVQHGGLRAHVRFRDAGADHIQAIEGCFGRNALLIDAEGEPAVLNVEIEVLANLVLVEDLANPDADLIEGVLNEV